MEFFSESQLQPQSQPQNHHSHHRHHHLHLSRRPRKRLSGPPARAVNPSPVITLPDPSRSVRQKKKNQKNKSNLSVPDPSSSSSSSPSSSSPPPPPPSSSSSPSPDPYHLSSGKGFGRSATVHHQTAKARPEEREESDEGNHSQQKAVLESLAVYLEGELSSRLQSYSELLSEAEAMSRERSFYRGKLLQIEKVCKHVRPFRANISKLDSILSILSTDVDMPFV